jgi:hypothetical protein
MAKLLLTAMLLLALTVLIHAAGTMEWMRHLHARYVSGANEITPWVRFHVLVTTALALTFLHILEIMLWALCYLYIEPQPILGTLEEAFYFSAVTFTALGYGDITLDPEWRILSGMQAINGILLIGWSTAFIFAVLQRIWGSMLGADGNISRGK